MCKRKNFIFSLFIALSVISSVMDANTHEPQWQEAKSITGNFKAISSQPDIEVFSAPNVIMVKVNQNVQVRIFTILGKLISDQHLEPGIFQFHLDSHGIYIIKTDETSCKIAL